MIIDECWIEILSLKELSVQQTGCAVLAEEYDINSNDVSMRIEFQIGRTS